MTFFKKGILTKCFKILQCLIVVFICLVIMLTSISPWTDYYIFSDENILGRTVTKITLPVFLGNKFTFLGHDFFHKKTLDKIDKENATRERAVLKKEFEKNYPELNINDFYPED